MAKIMSNQEWLQVVSQMATPIDFDSLIADGTLKRRSKMSYVVLDAKKVPAHVWRQARAIETATVKGVTKSTITVRDHTKAMNKLLVQAVGAQRAKELIAQVSANGTITDK
jgi:hypothetical protein